MDQTGKPTEKMCPACHEGMLHDYPQDAGFLRCGRCGEPHIEAEPKKPATNRRAK
jgi:hypothetical protein